LAPQSTGDQARVQSNNDAEFFNYLNVDNEDNEGNDEIKGNRLATQPTGEDQAQVHNSGEKDYETTNLRSSDTMGRFFSEPSTSGVSNIFSSDNYMSKSLSFTQVLHDPVTKTNLAMYHQFR
jgi:hypothetical protein